jgi:DNA-directed RNA polymerase subunit M/transcription elongation factor TFIIS
MNEENDEEIKMISKNIVTSWKKKLRPQQKKEIKTSTLNMKEQEDHFNTLPLEEETIITKLKNKIKSEEKDIIRQKMKLLLYDTFTKINQNQQDLTINDEEFSIIYTLCMKMECVFHEKLRTKDKYLKQTKAIIVSLSNKENIQFAQDILSGKISAEELVDMDQKDMVSHETKVKRQKIAEDMLNSRRSDWNKIHFKGVKGIYRCGKCKGNDTTYTQAQIRRADEPMTTYFI